MAVRKTTEPQKKFKALTPESIARERDRARKATGGGRRGLFWKPPSRNGRAIQFSQVMRFLPAVEERGPEGNLLPFFLIAQHWINRTNDDGDEYRAGVTCTDFIREEQPGACERYAKAKVDAILEKEDCLFCEVLNALREDDEDEDGDTVYHHAVPMGQYGGPEWQRRYAYNFAILLPEEDAKAEDSDTLVKIYPAPVSVKDAIYDLLGKKQFTQLLDPKLGWDVEVERAQKGRGPWQYSVTPAEKCPVWYSDWDSEMPDLEKASPHWMTREEAVEWMAEAHPEVLAAFGRPVSRRKTNVAAKKGTPKGKATASTSKKSASASSKTSTKQSTKSAGAKGTKKAVTKAKGKKAPADEEDED